MGRLLLVVALLAGATAATGSAATARVASGPLTGKWTGGLAGSTRTERITLTINSRETSGTWRVSASCHGTLTLDSISGGSHHYLRHRAAGVTCAGGDIDCLSRSATKVFDNVTPRANGWSRSGTLRRVPS